MDLHVCYRIFFLFDEWMVAVNRLIFSFLRPSIVYTGVQWCQSKSSVSPVSRTIRWRMRASQRIELDWMGESGSLQKLFGKCWFGGCEGVIVEKRIDAI